jgi:RNA-directed DNA polymerase
MVNRKVNVRTEYRRKTRSLAHELFKTGIFQHVRTIRDANGVVTPTTVEGTLEQLHGILGFIDQIDCHNFEREFNVDPHEAKVVLRSKEKLYRRFLMFKDFYAAKQPVIVCEGKTDNVYFLHAIRSLAAFYPKLATVDATKKITLNVRILKTVNTSTGRVLQLNGGASFLESFIKQYLVEIEKFKAPGMQCAVVVLVDNDKGGDDIYNAIRTLTKKKAPKSDLCAELPLVVWQFCSYLAGLSTAALESTTHLAHNAGMVLLVLRYTNNGQNHASSGGSHAECNG